MPHQRYNPLTEVVFSERPGGIVKYFDENALVASGGTGEVFVVLTLLSLEPTGT